MLLLGLMKLILGKGDGMEIEAKVGINDCEIKLELPALF